MIYSQFLAILFNIFDICKAIGEGGRDILEPGCRRYSYSNRPSQDCSALKLSTAPVLFPDVISLNLGNNTFKRIDDFPTSYGTLLSLRMDFCQIERVSIKALGELKGLKTLDLAHNNLQNIIFTAKNKGLTTLNLSFNKLRFLPDFSALTSLRLLDLSHNQLIILQPRFLPPNVESLRFTANQLNHLAPWPFLVRLQELDVSFNPLVCECPLWRFISWAENLALFDSSTLNCMKPPSLRRGDKNQLLCGPEVLASAELEKATVSLGEVHQLCCMVSSSPSPILYWQHQGRNITSISGTSVRHVAETGQARYCLEVQLNSLHNFGAYKCIASLAGLEQSKEFLIERDKVPLILHNPEGFLFYGEFAICVFLVVLCCVSCCCIRREHKRNKKRAKMDYPYSDYYYPPPCNVIPDFVRAPSPGNEDYQRLQLEIWRQRMALMPAPLAEFDQDTHMMPLIHTAV